MPKAEGLYWACYPHTMWHHGNRRAEKGWYSDPWPVFVNDNCVMWMGRDADDNEEDVKDWIFHGPLEDPPVKPVELLR